MKALASLALALLAIAPPAVAAGDLLPATLARTGYAPDSALHFAPQYTLWSDGAHKRRWIALPAGTSIDASKPDAWDFPPGTKLWKEFAYDGKPVETRFIERRADGSWRFASYVWDAQGREATLAPEQGVTVPVAAAPGGRYAVPSRSDCSACHGSAPVPVLGFSALQVAPELRALAARGFVTGLPRELLANVPRIEAKTPVERAALGYLHANCAHCHNTSANRVPLPLTLAQRAADPVASHDEVLLSTIGAATRWRPGGVDDARVVVPGHAADSMLVRRMQSRDGRTQMPPLGTQVPDADGLALVMQWIARLLPKETTP